MFTLHEDFDLTHDFLVEAIERKISEKYLIKITKELLEKFSDSKNLEATEEEIDEMMEYFLDQINSSYEQGNMTKERRDKLLKEEANRDKIKKQIEKYKKPTQELIAISEYIAALLGKPTNSFLRFLKMYDEIALEKIFLKLQNRYNNSLELKKLIPNLLNSVIKEAQTDEAIEYLGIYDDIDKELWKESVEELEDNLKNLLE